MEAALFSVAKDVRAQLDAFVSLQADITAQSGLFNSLKRLFRPVNFTQVLQTAKEIENSLSVCLQKINSCQVNSKAEQEFQQALARFTEALIDAVAKMNLTVDSLLIKNRGSSAWEDNTRLMQEYKLAEQKYLDLGQKLNSSYRKLMEEKNHDKV